LPQAVADELAEGRNLGVSLPDPVTLSWLILRQAQDLTPLASVVNVLGAGEREALALALEIPDSIVLLDDAPARRYARRLGIKFTGTLGVLLKAKQSGHLTTALPILDQLDSLGFRLDSVTRASVLKLACE
jgi:predicted nucleic acid-binding protein